MILKFRRLIALYIDFILIFYAIYYPIDYIQKISNSLIVNYSVTMSVITRIFFNLCALLIWFNIFIRKDIIFGYESIGKKIMRLKIYDEHGKRVVDTKKLVDRIFCSFNLQIAFYPFMILINNKSSGDYKMKTTIQ